MKRYTVEDLKAENIFFNPTLNGWTLAWIVEEDVRSIVLTKDIGFGDEEIKYAKSYNEAVRVINGDDEDGAK